MQKTLAIARLTLKAAFRFRLVPVLIVLLLGAVLALPLVIKDDGTARGLTQILLTYTLGIITALLGLATLWLGCGTLARDIEECQMQVVATKPVARWQIWLGKWLGILALNAGLLALAASAVYVSVLWRARSLPPEQQAVLRNEVLVARGSVKEPIADREADVERILQDRLKKDSVAAMDRSEVRRIIREQLKAQDQVVPPGYLRRWKLDLSAVKDALRGQPLFLRVNFIAAEKTPSGTYLLLWEIGPPETARRFRHGMTLAAESFHEFEVPPDLLDGDGMLVVDFVNQNETALLFDQVNGLEVLYREGGFGLNFFRGVCVIFCWLALLAALGLMAASFLSFPVAAFLSLGLLVVAFSTGTMTQILEQGTVFAVNPNTGTADAPRLLDHLALPVFSALLSFVNLVRGFSPVDALSTGRSVTWGTLLQAILQIALFMSGLFAALGIAIFTRRELATAQSQT